MEYGCLKDKRFGAIDGGNLSDFSDQTQEVRYVARNHFGRSRRFWEITTDPETMPYSTW